MAAAGLLVLACRGSSANPGPAAPKAAGGDAVTFETLLQRSIPGQAGGEIRDVARDEAAWKALWDRLREGERGILPAEPPAVDFSRDMVIVAAMPTQGCVAKVTIRGIAQSGGGLLVDLLEAPPAPNCVCIVSERPLHVVRLPRSEGTIRFNAEQGVTPCGP
ncbi:MAG TPA: hypothetical protein VKK31_03270 [Thermoanaerobaculia bacterium]|nr:hypothetical protein [Thermoanaerobaculia bacterium]